MKTFTVSICFVLLGIFIRPAVHPFSVESHGFLSGKALVRSTLDGFLISELNLSAGIEEMLAGKPVAEWIVIGSIREDDGIRPTHHFHNPLRSWDEFTNFGFSSICWAQATNCQGGTAANDFSWQQARENYFNGLTAGDQATREEKLALAFKILGHQIHLIQDAAVPPHTRNDGHPFFEGFETFVHSIRLTPLFDLLTSMSTPFDQSILALPQNKLAPIPISRIIDTTDPDQTALIPSAGTNVGIAEYSNPNFVSDDTIFTDFIFPREASLGDSFLEENGVTYRPKVSEGEGAGGEQFWIKHFVAQDEFGNYYLSQGGTPDDRIFKDYAARLTLPPQPNRLLPRAIGYSSGLIDYFIRGRIEIANPEVVRSQEDSCSATIAQVSVDVRNISPGENTGACNPGQCQIVGVVQSGTSYFVSPSQDFSLTETLQNVVFDFSSSSPPISGDPLFLTVVYRGPLGLEDDSVIGGGRDNFVPLTLEPQNPTLTCPDGSVTFTACSGTPPYSWSSSNPNAVITISGVNNETAVLTPPATNNSSEVAYVTYLREPTGPACGAFLAELFHVDCADRVISCSLHCGRCIDVICGGQNITLSTEPNSTFCPEATFISALLPDSNICDLHFQYAKSGYVCEKRSQAMIDAGCRPCFLEMQEATVTVKDSSTPTPGSANAVVTAQ